MTTQKISKRELLSNGALSASVGAGALALLMQTQRAAADTPFTSFPFAATGAPTPRTMPDRLAHTKNIKDFGAKGDAITDDTAAIQGAVNACYNDGGGEVFFPAGSYLVTSSINFNVSDSANFSIVFRGVGNKSAIISTSVSGFIFDRHLSGNENPKSGIRGFEKLKIQNGHATGGCIRMGSSQCGFIRDCEISGNQGIWLRDTANYNSGNGFERSFSQIVENCILNSGGNPANSNGVIVAHNSNIISCEFLSFNCAIRCYTGASLVSIIGCRIDTNNYGILLGSDAEIPAVTTSFGDAYIASCTFEGNQAALYVQAGGQVLMENCNIQPENGTTNPSGLSDYGIFLRGGSGVSSQCKFTNVLVVGTANIACIYIGDQARDIIFENCSAYSTNPSYPTTWRLPSVLLNPPIFINCYDYGVSGARQKFNPEWAYSQLPSGLNVAAGDTYNIKDCTTNAFGAFAAGGGSNHVQVRWNGSNWTVCGI